MVVGAKGDLAVVLDPMDQTDQMALADLLPAQIKDQMVVHMAAAAPVQHITILVEQRLQGLAEMVLCV